MTSVYHLTQCSVVILVLSCQSFVSVTDAVPVSSIDLSDEVKERKDIGRDIDRFGKRKGEQKVLPATPPAFSTTMTRLTVRVTPKNSVLPLPSRGIRPEEGSSSPINIICRIKCIVGRVEDIPSVSFCLQIGNETILPLSAGLPGVDLFTASTDSRMQKPFKDADNRRAVRTFRLDIQLTLNSNAYAFLRRGDNQFFCRAYSPSIGILKSDGFNVYRQ